MLEPLFFRQYLTKNFGNSKTLLSVDSFIKNQFRQNYSEGTFSLVDLSWPRQVFKR